MTPDKGDPYATLYALSQAMLACAEGGRWPQLIALEKERSHLIAQLKAAGDGASLRNTEDDAVQTIRAILALDGEIKSHIATRMKALKKGMIEERKLIETYGTPAFSP